MTILMTLCKLGSLETWRKQKKLSIGILISIIRDTCVPVCEMHNVGVVHNDIKPGNYLLDLDESGNIEVKLTDFGLSNVN